MYRKTASLALGFLAIAGLSGAAQAHVISEADHHAFEHKFAEMCVNKEKANVQATGGSEIELTKMCECIAQEESKRITIEEVRKFVKENKYPISLQMKSTLASYTCSQPK